MKKLIISIVMSLSMLSVVAQERMSLHTDFEMFFDNKEISKTNYAVQGLDIESGTDFYGRLGLSFELEWDKNNTLVVGADFRNNYGENTDGLFSTIRPLIHYRYLDDRWKFIAGIFHNDEMNIDSYSTAFYSEASRNIDNQMNGVLAQYRKGDSFAEFACNWNGEYSETSREKFEILSAARHYVGFFYYGYNYLMFHYAGSMDADNDGVVDLQKINPCIGFRFGEEFTADIKLGGIFTSQHDRSWSSEWEHPMMGELGVKLSYKGFSFDERLYVGENINPFFYGHTLDNGYYMEYGRELYPNESFFRTDKGIYNRAALSYERTMMSDKLNVRAEVVTHYDGYGFGTQYILSVRANLFTNIYNKANRNKNINDAN